MFILKKVNEVSDAYPEIEMTLPFDSTLDTLLEAFKGFLQASGFAINFMDDIVLLEEEKEQEMETIEVDMTEEQFAKIAEMAHEQDITFNEMCNRILRESMDKWKGIIND